MGRFLGIGFVAASISLLCAMLVLPVIIGNYTVNAGGSGTPWCDRYGFIYPDGLNTWSGNASFYGKHSGIFEYWESTNPSVHWSICNHAPAWQGSAYYNKQINYPYSYLSGNGLFIFFGHGERHCLVFTNGSSHSYLYDHSDNIPFGRAAVSSAIASSHYKMDYMKLAYLGGCETAKGSSGHISFWWRCGKGTDTVIGFAGLPLVWQAGEYIEGFFYSAIHQSCNMYWAALIAENRVRNVFGNNYMGDIDTRKTWGSIHTRIDIPTWGIYEGME